MCHQIIQNIFFKYQIKSIFLIKYHVLLLLDTIQLRYYFNGINEKWYSTFGFCSNCNQTTENKQKLKKYISGQRNKYCFSFIWGIYLLADEGKYSTIYKQNIGNSGA